MSAAGVSVSTAPHQGAGAGSIPSAALQALRIVPIRLAVAKALIVQHHYLHSLPGGTMLAFGALLRRRLLGAIILGVGPYNTPSLVEGATSDHCVTLTRLWLDDDLPKNSESRALGIVLRSLKRHTHLKFLVTYADPAQGHLGTIYQATGWLYSGLSDPMPLYDIGDGRIHHSRSLAHAYGTHSVEHFRKHGVAIRVLPQSAKHRYVYFLDPTWQSRLNVPVLSYPKKERGVCTS